MDWRREAENHTEDCPLWKAANSKCFKSRKQMYLRNTL